MICRPVRRYGRVPSTPDVAANRSPLPMLSVLDIAPVASDQTSRDAVRATTELARAADALGFARFWVAEHHNLPGIASTSPAVLIAHLGAVTTRMRIGSGGVMLPNHPPLVVAEQFALLEALYPGRIDLGLGRAPGTDPTTAAMLRRAAHQGALEAFAGEISEVQALLTAGWGDSDPAVTAGQQRFVATPRPVGAPDVWVLGSSPASAMVAAALSLPYAFAHHFGRAAAPVEQCVQLYRQQYQSSPQRPDPQVLVTASVVAAASEEEAVELALPAALSWADIARNRRRPLRTLAEAHDTVLDDNERALVSERLAGTAVGTADQAYDYLAALARRTGADELMLALQAPTVATRIATLRLLRRRQPN